MLQDLAFERLLVLDIETVSAAKKYTDLTPKWKLLWDLKAKTLKPNGEEQSAEELYARAGIYAEFGKIICISVGYFRAFDEGYQFRVKSFYGHDEKKLLNEFANLLNTSFHNKSFLLAGHNAKEFDFPYICRRMLANGVKLPLLLDIAGKKPWEIPHLDSMELWKFGDYKSYTSLNLLAALFDIATPKDDIDGSMVGQVYWEEQDVERIKTYCQKDIVTVAQIMLKWAQKPLLKEEDIIFVAEE